MLASQSTPIQHFLPPMLSSPPSRAATPSSSSNGPPPLSATAVSILGPTQPEDGSSSLFLHHSISASATLNGFVQHQDSTAQPSTPDPNADVDPQIIEALKSKDRIFVLKLGETMESLIREPSKMRMDVTAATTYQRMLVHRCSSFYKTALEVDQITKVFYIMLTPDSHIPERKISDLIPAEPTPQPAIKIMRRTQQDRKPKSQANSVAGDDAELSDVEPSEAGSLGGKSTSTSGYTKKRPTIEEREAAYKEARSRIFMGFEEKEKGNMNSSSSSLSLTSSSAGAGSSVGDLEESSSPATESEWSTSNVKENRKDFRRGSGASYGRTTLSGPTSVRNSRASSPSFKYASIYDSPPSASYYDPHLPYHEPPNPGYHPSQYAAPYPPQGHPSSAPFSPPYPYYPPYNPYQPPPQPQPQPQPQPHPADCMPPTNGEMYANQMGPGSNFAWHNQPPPHMQLPQPPQPHSNPNQMINAPPHPGQGAPYVSYAFPPYSYPAPGYYPTPGQMAPSYPNPAAVPVYDVSRPPNGSASPLNRGRPSVNNAMNGPVNSTRNSSGLGMNGAPKGRSGPTVPPTRSGWSYGPGIGMGGYVTSGGDLVGPRLSSSRRQSGNGSGSSGYSRASSINDDVSSTASSSTTSSSSRRTYTSTSSQHPLPPRPDWAVGMTPSNPSLGRHYHDHHSRSMSSTNVARNGAGTGPVNVVLPPSGPGMPPPPHPTDFPPLTPSAIPERHPPNSITMGAWGNSNSRTVLLPAQGQHQRSSAKLYPNSAHNMSIYHFDESDSSFERPPPKFTELYNHKSGKRHPASSVGGVGRLQDGEKDQRAKNDSLVEQIAAVGIGEQGLPAAAPVKSAAQESSSALTIST
ncbi:hypothetical protein AX15_006534 [Amanita polypyramis BW_CC]|nr:hypothetical protein AX15_006534 [Amanita polypyramis BW_CC]